MRSRSGKELVADGSYLLLASQLMMNEEMILEVSHRRVLLMQL